MARRKEIPLDLKMEEWGDKFKWYIKEHCNPKGGKSKGII
jgi:hypothetical protein